MYPSNNGRKRHAFRILILAAWGTIPTASWAWFRTSTSLNRRMGKLPSVVRTAAQNSEEPERINGFRSFPPSTSPTIMSTPGNSMNSTTEIRELRQLQEENERLRQALTDAVQENERLVQKMGSRIIIEDFEGESRINSLLDGGQAMNGANGTLETTYGSLQSIEECYIDDDDECPLEPRIPFGEALRDRAYWLVGLLIAQSCSGFILASNEALLESHPIIVYFLTMLVGAGGNAGNQASVRVIRGLALGTLNAKTQRQFLVRELKMASALSVILSFAGFARAIIFRTPLPETIAVTAALALIVFTSVGLGAILPLLLKFLGVDPAHSSTTIQVVMDILGVLLCVLVSGVVLDSPIGGLLLARFT